MPIAKQRKHAAERAPASKARGRSKDSKHPSRPSRQTELRRELKAVIDKPALWLETPNTLFGGRIPRELIGTDDEKLLWDWVGSVKHGLTS
jgi:hypothetical protein